jgi:hypothetical protein
MVLSCLIMFSFVGWFNGKPENKPIIPDTGNAVEGKKRIKGFWLTPKPFVF